MKRKMLVGTTLSAKTTDAAEPTGAEAPEQKGEVDTLVESVPEDETEPAVVAKAKAEERL